MFNWERKQLGFDDVDFFGEPIFNQDHILVKLAKIVPWDKLEEKLMRFYSPDKGCPSTSLRAQTGTLMLKHLYNRSDRDTVAHVQESMYAQRFCNLNPKEAQTYMNPANGLTNYRNKIGPEGQALIAETMDDCLKGKKLIKNRKMITDTTVVPADIRYPIRKAKDWGVTQFFKK